MWSSTALYIVLFPAYAGVIPMQAPRTASEGAFPRIRGGDPRMWSSTALYIVLFPAYAGVIPMQAPRTASEGAFPRIRGGDPIRG